MTPTRITFLDIDYPIVKETSPGAASNRKGEITQYALPLRWGCIALIAHNYLAGAYFGDLNIGDPIILSSEDEQQPYVVTRIKRYQALTPSSSQSKFIDLDDNTTITYSAVFHEMYEVAGRLVLQTCIGKGLEQSWGRLFVVCEKQEAIMAYTPGADYSYWQAQNNFDKAKAEGLRFAIFRAGFNTAIDPRFVENVQNAKDKLIRGAYWFYDWRPTGATVEKQGAAFKSMLASSPIEINVPAMDFENPYAGFSPTAFPNRLNALQIMQRFKDAVGAKRMMLYINSSTLKTLRPFPTWLLEEWDLWIAAWPLNKSPMYYTDIPSDWQPDTYGWKWTFWQYTAKMDGKRFGAGSLDLDGDIFNGDEDALRVYANMTTTPPPPPDPDPECPDTSAVIDELEDAQLGIEEGLNLIRAAQARIDQARRLLE